MRSILLLLGLAVFVATTPVTSDSICNGQESHSVVSFIGKDKNVKMETITCGSSLIDSEAQIRPLEIRQTTNVTNECGTACQTNCFLPAGGGPDPNECHVIADALLFASENTGALFQVPNGVNNTVALTFRSCKTFFVNQNLGPVSYCRSDWASLVDFVSLNCQATQNAHGGNCVANTQEWFIQIQHS